MSHLLRRNLIKQFLSQLIFCLLLTFCFIVGPQPATVSPIGPDELPPPYQAATQGGGPMVTCRVCQAMIDVSGKKDQHVVKCNTCSEATVCHLKFCI